MFRLELARTMPPGAIWMGFGGVCGVRANDCGFL